MNFLSKLNNIIKLVLQYKNAKNKFRKPEKLIHKLCFIVYDKSSFF